MSSLPCVLIVDDAPQVLRLLHSILEDMAQLVFAKSGEDALTQVAVRPPDLILLDAQMPGLGGYATCSHLKSNPETADIPIVFVTAHTDTDSETHALDLGAEDFIHKPINPPVVRARVRTQLVLKQKTDALRRLTIIDALTGIANRRAFDEALNLEWRRSAPARPAPWAVRRRAFWSAPASYPAGSPLPKPAGRAETAHSGGRSGRRLPHPRPLSMELGCANDSTSTTQNAWPSFGPRLRGGVVQCAYITHSIDQERQLQTKDSLPGYQHVLQLRSSCIPGLPDNQQFRVGGHYS